MPIIGVITATLCVAGGKYPCELKVIKGLTYKAVLGRDFLFENEATINMITNVLELSPDVKYLHLHDFMDLIPQQPLA